MKAPVADPGLMKNRPSNSNASNRWVEPDIRMSTSSLRAMEDRDSVSPNGTT